MLIVRIYLVKRASFLKEIFEIIQNAPIGQHLHTAPWRPSSSLVAGCTPAPCRDRHLLASCAVRVRASYVS